MTENLSENSSRLREYANAVSETGAAVTTENAVTQTPVFVPHAFSPRVWGWKGLQSVQKFGGWWFSLAAIYATIGGGCPCCGNVGCPVGGAGAGFLGAIFMTLWRRRLNQTHIPHEVSMAETKES